MKKTSLHKSHLSLNAKMVPFAGYDMPVTYQKIATEYESVRTNCGIFDVSHMGQINIKGKDSISFIQYLTVNDLNDLEDNEAQYSAMCNQDGKIIDDLIVYKLTNENFLIIVNASNTQNVLEWIDTFKANYAIDIHLLNTTHSLIAVQGPKSREILSSIFEKNIEIEFYHLMRTQLFEHDIIISRTGYTGELGFEILAEHSIINKLWNLLIKKRVVPCGLAVRDVLRMEMKYCLYGNDISIKTNPIEAGLSWIVKLKKDFIGKELLLKYKKSDNQKRLIGFKMLDKAIPRKGYNVLYDNELIGNVTSGTHSPQLNQGIGLAYINKTHNKIGNIIEIEIRGRLMNAEIVKTPFINNTSIHS